MSILDYKKLTDFVYETEKRCIQFEQDYATMRHLYQLNLVHKENAIAEGLVSLNEKNSASL